MRGSIELMRQTIRVYGFGLSLLALASCGSMPNEGSFANDAAPAQPDNNKIGQLPNEAEQQRIAGIDAEEAFAEATTAYSRGDYDGAAALFRDAALASGEVSAWINLGVALVAANRADDALAALQRATQIAPERSEAWVQRGLAERQLGKFLEAEQSYKKALAIDANHALAWRNLGVLYEVYLGRKEAAVEAYQKSQAAAGVADPDVADWIRLLQSTQVAAVAGGQGGAQ